jgi:mannose/fructose-specific phosphotransferase system component IIA
LLACEFVLGSNCYRIINKIIGLLILAIVSNISAAQTSLDFDGTDDFVDIRAEDYLVLGDVDGASVMNQTITIILRNASSAIID